jgi:hypothetical protein
VILTDIQSVQGGVYTVGLTNIAGSATSAAAFVSVISPVPRRIVPALLLAGEAGDQLAVESCVTIAEPPAWKILETVTLTDTTQWYFDVTAPSAQGFYRARQVNGSGAAPALGLQRVPAITLTGPVGSVARLDYINQFGPSDAWVTLATVALTNASQLYFDTSTIHQPPRLYRLVVTP